MTKGLVTGLSYQVAYGAYARITMTRQGWVFRGYTKAPFRPDPLLIEGFLCGSVAQSIMGSDGPPVAYFYPMAGDVYLEDGRKLMSSAREVRE